MEVNEMKLVKEMGLETMPEQLIESTFRREEDPFSFLGQGEFGVNEWGSCQYSTAASAFAVLKVLRDRFGATRVMELIFGEKIEISKSELVLDGFIDDETASLEEFRNQNRVKLMKTSGL